MLLHDTGKLDLQTARHDDAVFRFQQVRDTALPGLAVDAYHRVIIAADILGVDRKVRHIPGGIRLLYGKTFLDRILVRTGKRREYQVTHIGMARMYGQLVAVLDRARNGIDVGKIQAGVYPLRIEIQGQSHNIHIAGTLAIAEQTPLDTVGTRHQAQLGRRHGSAAVVVRVQAKHDAIAPREMAVHPFDLVGIDIGRGEFNSRRQIKNNSCYPVSLPMPRLRHCRFPVRNRALPQ